ALVARHHRLHDLGLQRQHALDPLRRDIVALVVDDQILLAVGDLDPALLVEVPDVARCQPTVLEHTSGLFFVAPIAAHDELTANHDFAILGDAHFGVLDRRPDGIEPDADAWPVTADHRTRFSLAVALKEGNPERL